MKLLDSIGLNYFLGKIKAWALATFASITHTQASNTINAMTGYSKPSSGSAIAASDSLNSAVGKLEAKVDAVTAPTIPDLSRTISGSGNAITDITVSGHAITATKGATFLTSHQTLPTLSLTTSGSGNAITTLSVSNHAITATKGSTFLTSHQDISGKVNKSGDTMTGQLIINRDNGSAGGGLKLTGDAQNFAISICDTGITKGTAPSGQRYCGIEYYGNDNSHYNKRLGILEFGLSAANLCTANLRAYNCTSDTNTGTCTISCNVDSSGNVYTAAPTPATADNSTKIATTAFVKAQGYITGSGNTTGSSGSCTGNAATATKATNDSDGNAINSTYLKLSGGTMTGNIVLKKSNITRGSTTTAVTCDFLDIKDSANNRISCYSILYYANKSSETNIYAYNTTASSGGNIGYIGIGCNSSGTVYTHAPTPATSSNDTNIATTAFVKAQGYITSSGSITGNAATATITKGNKGTGSYVASIKSGNALVNADNTTFGSVWNAPTKSYRVACATWPDNGDNIIWYSITNANVSSSTNTTNKIMTWNAGTGILTATGFAGPLTGNVTGNCSGTAANVTGTVAIANGGTGATTRLNAVKALTNEDVGTNAQFFLTITSSWGKAGYTSVANAKTVLGLKSAAYTESSAYATSGHTHSYLPLSGGTLTGDLILSNKLLKPKITGVTRGTSTTANYPFVLQIIDNANVTLGGIYYEYLADKTAKTHLMCYQGTTNANTWKSIGVGYNSSGNVFTWAPTPATSSNDTNIATTAFVKAQGYLTSHQSLSNYCTLNSNQTISATKTISQVNTTVLRTTGNSDEIAIYGSTSGITGSCAKFHGISATTYDPGGTARKGSIEIMAGTASTYKCIDFTAASAWFECSILPNGTQALGHKDYRWNSIYLNNNPNVSSDRRIKSFIGPIPDNVLDTWENIEWKQFKLNDAIEEKGEDAARFHTGLIVQDIKEAFEADELDPGIYGLYCYDTHEERKERKDENGKIICTYRPAGDSYSLRYTEALCMEAAYQRRRADRLEARIAVLEAKLLQNS